MEDRFNTIAGWALGAGIVALGGALVAGEVFRHHPVEKGGYVVAEAEVTAGPVKTAEPIDWSKVDAARGEEVFKQCSTCHNIEEGQPNKTGPDLWATLGKPLAHHVGFAYSDAIKAKGGTWTFEAMDLWLQAPKKYVPGTKMSFAGISNAGKRGDLIAYINSKGSNLPLPAGPAVAPAADAAAAPAADAANAAAPAANAAAPAAAK